MASSTLIFATLLFVTLAAAADPTCSTGLKSSGVCCPAGCEKCGGSDCGMRSRMKGLKCCIGAIKNMDANCLTSDPPCKITTKDPDFMAGSDVADPRCTLGLRKNRACCPPECSVCGGKGCRARGALINSMCCPNEIKAGPRGCKDTGAPCALFKKSTEPMMETPIPSPEPMEMDPTPTPEIETPLPRVCKNMRSEFVGGCFCYLLVSQKIKVKQAKLFRKSCRSIFGSPTKIKSMAFDCRRFVNGPKAPTRVERLIKRINVLIPICDLDLPMVEQRM